MEDIQVRNRNDQSNRYFARTIGNIPTIESDATGRCWDAALVEQRVELRPLPGDRGLRVTKADLGIRKSFTVTELRSLVGQHVPATGLMTPSRLKRAAYFKGVWGRLGQEWGCLLSFNADARCAPIDCTRGDSPHCKACEVHYDADLIQTPICAVMAVVRHRNGMK